MLRFYVFLMSKIVKLKVLPSLGTDSTHIFPLCLSTIFLQIANPIPTP